VHAPKGLWNSFYKISLQKLVRGARPRRFESGTERTHSLVYAYPLCGGALAGRWGHCSNDGAAANSHQLACGEGCVFMFTICLGPGSLTIKLTLELRRMGRIGRYTLSNMGRGPTSQFLKRFYMLQAFSGRACPCIPFRAKTHPRIWGACFHFPEQCLH